MSDEVLTPEERLRALSDAILASIIRKDDISKANRQILFGQLNPKVFKEENHILYTVLYNFKEQKLTPDEDFYMNYLLRNRVVFTKSQNYININAYSDLNEDPIVGYVSGVIKSYNRLKTLEILDNEDFKLSVEKYKLEYKNNEMGAVLSKSRSILFDGLQVGKRSYQGYDDSIAFTKKSIADIESVVSTTSGDGFVDASEYGMREEEDTKLEKIADFGDIKELNDIYGGIYTSLFYSIMAPTKTGKSKFTARLAHNAVVNYSNNIVIWPYEGGKDMFLAQMRAIHFDHTYNRSQTDVAQIKVGVDQASILEGNYPSPAIKELEIDSKTDLFTNPNYGNMQIIDKPFNVETFIEDIETAVQLNNAKAVFIDYLQLIGSTTNGASKSETIGKAYQKLLAFAKARKVAVITPAQFKQDTIQDLSKSKSINGAETRTAGGESSEVVRTPDINIGLYASMEDLANNRMQIVSVPSRLGKVFAPIELYCDLGCCYFCSALIDDLDVNA